MNSISKPILLFFVPLLFVAAGISCKKFVTVPPPVTQVTAAGAFASDATADATVAGLYSRIMESNLYFLNGATTLYPALSADELYRTSPNSTTDAFTANALSPQNPILSTNLWNKAYAYIYQANACLEGLAAAASVSTGVKQRLSGEVLFVRALAYFYLANLFGDVPLALTTDYTANAVLPRSPVADVYQQVTSDLTQAKALLSPVPSLPSATRPNGLAATALLARMYLWQGNPQGAEAEADTVINSGIYQLEAPESVFLSNSRETVFQLSPVVAGVNTAEGLTFIPYSSSVKPTYALTDSLLAAFEPGDGRRQAWVDSAVVNGAVLYYPYKYKIRNSDDNEESNVVLRLAEQYLIRAEARAQQGETEAAAADVNVIRERAGLPSLPEGIPGAGLPAAIAQENRIEFFAEWGHRWLDLKRERRADAVLGMMKSGWQGTDTLYPIPYGQILLNPGLTQNPGY